MRAASNSFIRPKYTGIGFRVQLLGLFMLLRCICNAVTSGSLATGGADDMCGDPGCELSSSSRRGLHITLSMLVYVFIFLQATAVAAATAVATAVAAAVAAAVAVAVAAAVATAVASSQVTTVTAALSHRLHLMQDGQGMLTFMLFGGLDEKARPHAGRHPPAVTPRPLRTGRYTYRLSLNCHTAIRCTGHCIGHDHPRARLPIRYPLGGRRC